MTFDRIVELLTDSPGGAWSEYASFEISEDVFGLQMVAFDETIYRGSATFVGAVPEPAISGLLGCATLALGFRRSRAGR
jgi:hypothetical protein